jgi:tetratricopeptide (TPR) repeat protein
LGIRGNLHLISGEMEAAEQRYREILEIEPANGNAFSALSRLAARDGDRQRVTALLDEGLVADPDNINLLARRALEHEKAGEYSQAIALYEKVYDRAPGMPVIANNLASLLADHAAGDPEIIARAHAIASRLKTSEIPQFRDTYGWTRYLNGEYDEALAYIEPLTEALPDNPWIWYHLAKIYVALDRQGDARIAFEAALEKGGENFVRADEISATLAEFANN